MLHARTGFAGQLVVTAAAGGVSVAVGGPWLSASAAKRGVDVPMIPEPRAVPESRRPTTSMHDPDFLRGGLAAPPTGP